MHSMLVRFRALNIMPMVLSWALYTIILGAKSPPAFFCKFSDVFLTS